MVVKQIENNQSKIEKFFEIDPSFLCALVTQQKTIFYLYVSLSLHFLSNQDPWCVKRKLLLNIYKISKHQKAYKDVFAAIESRDAELAPNEIKRHVNKAQETFPDVI